MKKQIMNRLGAAHVRDTLEQFTTGAISRFQAMESLQVGQSQLYALRTSYLAARAAGRGGVWVPHSSGGNHMPTWPADVESFLRDVLGANGGARNYSYAFAASEASRLFKFEVDRSQVRRWAFEHGIRHEVPKPRPPAHVRRWQRSCVGELWQLDATPDRFLGEGGPTLCLIDMLDDCSRVQVGGRLYAREVVESYLDFFCRAFTRYGLPLEIYVDRASFFRGDDGALTQLGKRLKFLDVSFIFANSPEAKGKIERVHQVWQDRFPVYAEHAGLSCMTPLDVVNEHFGYLVDHRNSHEVHRDINDIPQQAWDAAVAEGRNKLRPIPKDGWWDLIWAVWKGVVIGPRGRLVVGDTLCTTECANGTRAWSCLHLDGTVSIVLEKPTPGSHPKVLFTNNSKVNLAAAPFRFC